MTLYACEARVAEAIKLQRHMPKGGGAGSAKLVADGRGTYFGAASPLFFR
jgi:hypothetical protein